MAKFAVGDLVMYADREQTCRCGMQIVEVAEPPHGGDTLYRLSHDLDGKWWYEKCLIRHKPWRRYRRVRAT